MDYFDKPQEEGERCVVINLTLDPRLLLEVAPDGRPAAIQPMAACAIGKSPALLARYVRSAAARPVLVADACQCRFDLFFRGRFEQRVSHPTPAC